MENDIIGLEQIFPDAYIQNITLISMYCFELKKSLADEALNIMKNFINTQLHDNYNHLKRCKKTNDNVQILIGFCKNIPSELYKELTDINKGDIEIKEVKVSRYPPMTKKQYSEWSKFWPLYYRKPAYDLSTLTKEQIKKYINFIKISIDVGKNFGTCQSGCILTYNDKIVASSGDNIKNHPLQHSVMLAIEEASYKLRHLLQIKKMISIRNCEHNNKINNYLSKSCIQPLTYENSKLKDFKEQNNNNNVKKSTVVKEENCKCDEKMLKDDDKNLNLNIYKPIKINQYLCTNYFAYLSHEPCFMCAMAMVHSRIKCVIFDKVNKENGALFSKEKLHCLKNLNHHFKVFKTIRKNS
ncbi:cytidine deaminase, putative [Plasmodium gallinaceum]|uniref:Cytidine deaminase, putative n=1 Tax=Plasmodium gallinaceum TaxID=5849 RepID=A0A1J1GU27_PLAGA|nr:cytidine deaminase, putative [Plasmodium gallinaceum]CRG95959.1 cytidine deaminase, putative [Plasmodium gallinaceum]